MKALGPLAVSVSGTTLSDDERRLISSQKVGMIVLFRENWDKTNPDPKSALKRLTADIRSMNPNVVIAVDHEGGKVWRFNEGFTKLPSAKTFGDLYDQNPDEALKYAFEQGRIMADELLDCGVDVCLGPVLDLHGKSNVIGKLGRAFHSDPEVVAELAEAFIKGMNDAGMPATGKHFPGHGSCELDSHVAMPVDERPFEELQQDMYPFKALAQKGLLAAVMPALVTYTAVDKDNTAGCSSIWIQIFRKDCNGEYVCVMSDCLSMKGAGPGSILERLRAAQEAGCDFLMLTHQHGPLLSNLLEILDDIPDSKASEERRALFVEKIKRRQVQINTIDPIQAMLDVKNLIAAPVYSNHIVQKDIALQSIEIKENKENMELSLMEKVQNKKPKKEFPPAEIGFDINNDDGLEVYIDTERLHMASVKKTDLEAYCQLFGDKEVMQKFLYGIPLTKEEVTKRVNRQTQAWADKNPFSGFSIFEQGTDPIIGSAGLGAAPVEEKNSAEMFYLLHKIKQRQGYGPELGTALVKDYAPELQKRGEMIRRPDGKKESLCFVYAVAREDNPASWNILETVGLKHEDTIEKYGATRRVYRGKVSPKPE